MLQVINELIDGISVALNKEFGDDYEIYTESIEQGLTEPCFFIQSLSVSDSASLGTRYLKGSSFCVQYFPSTSEPNRECNNVFERMSSCLGVLTVGNVNVRICNFKGETVDWVLSVFFTVNMFVYVQTNENNEMDSYDVNANVKG